MAGILQVEQIQGPTSGANANTITIPAGQTLTVADGLPIDAMPAGANLQMVQQQFTTYENVTSTSFTDTLVSISITTTRDNSKILYTGNIGWNPSAGRYISYRLLRNGTAIYTPGRISPDAEGGEDSEHMGFIGFLDTPNVDAGTTVTYLLQMLSQQNLGGVRINDNLKSNVILQEIAG